MGDVAIQVENLSKLYRLGVKEQTHDTLTAAAIHWLKSPLNNLRRLRRLTTFSHNGQEETDVIYALKDVSFTVNQGEVVGIIGRNGAGKSTLLKILSRITPPSSGRVTLQGRVASLLEVGTGFHPELTGRENVYLNGTVLGMTKTEVDRKFDEIVDFSGVERFIDTPVKRYSSGMKVRLAFSVAAHLEPEILLVDEVLAVGDAEFQYKCLGKMENVAGSGRTILFVSHNMQAIQRLCRVAYLLNEGSIAAQGSPYSVISDYLDDAAPFTLLEKTQLEEGIELNQVKVLQNSLQVTQYVGQDVPFDLVIEYTLKQKVSDLLVGFDLISSDGTLLFRSYDTSEHGLGVREPGFYVSTFKMPGNLLHSGFYYMDILVGIHRVKWLVHGSIRIKIHVGGLRSTDITYPGIIYSVGQWQVNYM